MIILILLSLISELSTSIRVFQYDLKPGEAKSESGRLLFDTHAVVRLFEENGSASFVTSSKRHNITALLITSCWFSSYINIFHEQASRLSRLRCWLRYWWGWQTLTWMSSIVTWWPKCSRWDCRGAVSYIYCKHDVSTCLFLLCVSPVPLVPERSLSQDRCLSSTAHLWAAKMMFFTIFWYFMDQMNRFIAEISDRWISNENNRQLQPWSSNLFRVQMSNLLLPVVAVVTFALVVWSRQEIMLQRVMSQIAAVKKDMIILEKSEFSTLLAENEVSVFTSCCIASVQRFWWPPSSRIHINVLVCGLHDISTLQHFSQKLKIQLLQLKVQLAVSDYSDLLRSVYVQVLW